MSIELFQRPANPRHIVTDGRFMYVSLNAGSKLAKVDLTSRKVARIADTGKYPRTIAISGDGKTLFVVCYQGDLLQAFSADDLKPLGAWKSSLHPVGVDLFEDSRKREVWVGNYSSGTMKIFSFPVKEI